MVQKLSSQKVGQPWTIQSIPEKCMLPTPVWPKQPVSRDLGVSLVALKNAPFNALHENFSWLSQFTTQPVVSKGVRWFFSGYILLNPLHFLLESNATDQRH